jgi:ribose-phosphate pyrophosphokinase
MIKVTVYTRSGYEIPWSYDKFIFSGGEIQVKMNVLENQDAPLCIDIFANMRNASEIMELFLITDAIKHVHPGISIHLEMPYFPYARQDRVCSPGEASSAHVMINLIEDMGYKTVTVWDIHNPEILDCLQHWDNLPASNLIKTYAESILKNDENTVYVAPDKGAIDRVANVATFAKSTMMIAADKIRDPKDGTILGIELIKSDQNKFYYPDLSCFKNYLEPELSCIEINADTHLIIVDDICDGGRTFIELAKILREYNPKQIDLWVTHGIFSQGFDVFKGLIDNIYTANCFQPGLPSFVHVGEI